MHKMKRKCGKWGQSISRAFRPAVYVVSMACLWAMVAAQAAVPPTAPPTVLPPSERCSRDLVSTVWGFILTFVALSLDDWGTWKNSDESYFWKVVVVTIMGLLNPMVGLFLRQDAFTVSWMWRSRMSTPKARSYFRTLSGCDVVVNLSATAYGDFLKLRTDLFFLKKLEVEDFSDALVVGHEVDRKETTIELTALGKEMLMRAGVLPPVERLKILQGNSGLAVAVSAAQGVGYIYGILVRVVQGRHVSPIEAIGFYLSIIILIKAMFHYFASSCHRPLLLFLDDKQEIELINKCRAHGSESPHIPGLTILIYGGIIIFPNGALLFLIINIVRFTSLTLVIPLIIFIVWTLPTILSVLASGYSRSYTTEYVRIICLSILLPIMYAIACIYSLTLTWRYWNSLGFDINTSGYLSKILPYIG